jgi:hypothetical protein
MTLIEIEVDVDEFIGNRTLTALDRRPGDTR